MRGYGKFDESLRSMHSKPRELELTGTSISIIENDYTVIMSNKMYKTKAPFGVCTFYLFIFFWDFGDFQGNVPLSVNNFWRSWCKQTGGKHFTFNSSKTYFVIDCLILARAVVLPFKSCLCGIFCTDLMAEAEDKMRMSLLDISFSFVEGGRKIFSFGERFS